MAQGREQFRKASNRALKNRDFDSLRAICREARAADPANAEAWFLESVAAEVKRNLRDAISLVEKAVSLAPDNVEYLVQQARYLSQAGDSEGAHSVACRAMELGVTAPQQLDTLGVVLTRAGAYEDAAIMLREAVARRGDQPQLRFNLAAAEQFLGNENAARVQYEKVLTLAPGHARSYWALSELEKNHVDTRHEDAMRRLLQRPGINDRDELYLAHALARIDEERGDYAAAINLLAKAKTRRRSALNYDFDSDAVLFRALERYPAQAREKRDQGSGDVSPLFIVGLPRTGTTLVERVLSAHSAIDSLGEIQALPHAVKRLSSVPGPRVFSEEIIESFSRSAPDVALAYHQALADRYARLDPGVQWAIDKTPLNFFYVGIILETIPDARVIILRRDPMDAGLSNFRQLFALEYSYYNYSYDLRDTGRYVAAFERLVEIWETRYRDRFVALQYETLVTDPEPTIRGLLAYLDLPWEEACLRFHENKAAVATPSGVQVRQPLYRGAIDRWRRYGDVLAPMAEAIASAPHASD